MRSPPPTRPAQPGGRSPTCQAGRRPGRRAGHPLDVLAPLERDLPARLHLPRRHRCRATPARHRLRPGRRADPDHRSGTATAPARRRHPTTPARPRPPAALVMVATPPPAPGPPSPPTLERLRRDCSMITTNYSRRIRGATAFSRQLRNIQQNDASSNRSSRPAKGVTRYPPGWAGHRGTRSAGEPERTGPVVGLATGGAGTGSPDRAVVLPSLCLALT